MVTKTNISSVLSQDFGVEDFDLHTGALNIKGQESINDYALSNKLGLMSALADRNDTEVVTFGAEAYSLLGEANQLGQIATAQINNVNQRFAIAAEIKKNYGVEGFDAFAYGCEGFGDAIKNAFTAVVAAIKKIIQSITNWIRQVMNWVGSQFAKGQAKLIEKYGSKDFSKAPASITIKAALPAGTVKSGTQLIEPIDAAIAVVGKGIATLNKDSLAAIELGDQSLTTAQLKTNTAATALPQAIAQITIPTAYGKKIPVLKLGVASKVANLIVFGTEKLVKIPVSAVSYLNKVSWKTLLSKEDLKAAQDLVKFGKALIKVLNETLKTADKLAKAMKVTGVSKKDMTAKDKKQNELVKANRKAISSLNNCNRIGSLFAGILYGSFANYLKLRSYTAAAVKALAKGTDTGKQPKAGSAKDNLAKARQAINA